MRLGEQKAHTTCEDQPLLASWNFNFNHLNVTNQSQAEKNTWFFFLIQQANCYYTFQSLNDYRKAYSNMDYSTGDRQ